MAEGRSTLSVFFLHNLSTQNSRPGTRQLLTGSFIPSKQLRDIALLSFRTLPRCQECSS